jgi:hypothetical protein
VGPKLVYDAADLAKNAYMLDPIEFCVDLKDSVFKIILTCGTDVGLWRFLELMASQNSKEHGTPGYSTNCYDEIFFVAKFA